VFGFFVRVEPCAVRVEPRFNPETGRKIFRPYIVGIGKIMKEVAVWNKSGGKYDRKQI